MDEQSQRTTVSTTHPPRVSGAYYPALILASTSLWAIILGPVLTTLPGQVAILAPADRVSALALVAGIGGLVGIVSNPLIGRLSDATRSRFGRRRPWILAGAVLILPTALAAGNAGSLGELVLWWGLVQLCANLIMGPLTATIPDLVPEVRRGVASACLGISWAFAPVLGSAVQAFMVEPAATFLTLGALVLGAQLLFLLTLRGDVRVERSTLIQASPRWDKDFMLIWVHRFLFALGQNIAISYLFFYLQDVIRYEQQHPGSSADDGVLILTAIYAPCVIVAALLAGWLSDRVDRRKVYIVGSTFVFAAGAFLGAFTGSWEGVLVLAALTGIGFGAYEATSMAMVMRLLPSDERRARDLSFINVATLIAIAIGPVVAAAVINQSGYVAMFVSAGVAVLVSGLVVLAITRAK